MIRRRQFLAGAGALGAGAALERLGGLGAGEQARAATPDDAGLAQRIPFAGEHQAGILTARPRHAIFAAFDVIVADRAQLADGLRALSDRAARHVEGYRALLGAPGEGPTPDSGVLGPVVPPDALTVTIGLGASLFDRRFGLAGRRPAS